MGLCKTSVAQLNEIVVNGTLPLPVFQKNTDIIYPKKA